MVAPHHSKEAAVSVSIIVPVLNEEKSIRPAVLLIQDALESAARVGSYELIIVNDGSSDKTAGLAKKLSEDSNSIIYLENETTQGIGYCYNKGLSRARYDFVGWLAGDGSYIKKELVSYFDTFDPDKVCIAYPYSEDAVKDRTLLRRFVSAAYRFFIVNVFKLNAINYINGFVLYKRAFLQTITIRSNGFGICAELAIKAHRAKFTFRNIKMNSVERKEGRSKIFSIKSIIELIKTLSILVYKS